MPTVRAALARIAMVVAVIASASPCLADPPIVTVGTRTFGMRDDSSPPISLGKRKVSWSVRSGDDEPEHQFVVPLPGSAGDPTTAGATGGGAVLTVYNGAGSGEAVTVDLPADHWHLQGTPPNAHRFVYIDSPSTGAIWKVYLKGAKISVRGGKQHWGYTLDEPSQGSIAVRLTLGTEATYCGEVLPKLPEEKFDKQDRFLGRLKSPAPVACPPLP